MYKKKEEDMRGEKCVNLDNEIVITFFLKMMGRGDCV